MFSSWEHIKILSYKHLRYFNSFCVLGKKRFPLKYTDKWGLLFQCFHTFFHLNFVLSVENSSLAHNNDSILLVKPFNEAHDFPYFPLEKHEQSWHGVIFLNFHFQIEPSSCKKRHDAISYCLISMQIMYRRLPWYTLYT